VLGEGGNLHIEACAYLASLRALDRSWNTERTYAVRVALFLGCCSVNGVEWVDAACPAPPAGWQFWSQANACHVGIEN